MIDLNGMSGSAFIIAEKRKKNGGKVDTKTIQMLKHAATEVVEAMEAYTYTINEIPRTLEDIELSADEMYEHNKTNFASELADIVCCVMIIAYAENIDLEQAITACIDKNRRRAEGTGDKK